MPVGVEEFSLDARRMCVGRPGVRLLRQGAGRTLKPNDISLFRVAAEMLGEYQAHGAVLRDLRDIRLQPPPLAAPTGKGAKIRHVPLGGNTAALLSAYLAEHGLDQPGHDDQPLFTGQHGSRLSRGGIAWIIGKYQAGPVTPHSPEPT